MEWSRICNKFLLKQLPFYAFSICEQNCNVDCLKHERMIECDRQEKRHLRKVVVELQHRLSNLYRERAENEIRMEARVNSYIKRVDYIQKGRERMHKLWVRKCLEKDCEIATLKDELEMIEAAKRDDLRLYEELNEKRMITFNLEKEKDKQTIEMLEKEIFDLYVCLDQVKRLCRSNDKLSSLVLKDG